MGVNPDSWRYKGLIVLMCQTVFQRNLLELESADIQSTSVCPGTETDWLIALDISTPTGPVVDETFWRKTFQDIFFWFECRINGWNIESIIVL